MNRKIQKIMMKLAEFDKKVKDVNKKKQRN